MMATQHKGGGESGRSKGVGWPLPGTGARMAVVSHGLEPDEAERWKSNTFAMRGRLLDITDYAFHLTVLTCAILAIFELNAHEITSLYGWLWIFWSIGGVSFLHMCLIFFTVYQRRSQHAMGVLEKNMTWPPAKYSLKLLFFQTGAFAFVITYTHMFYLDRLTYVGADAYKRVYDARHYMFLIAATISLYEFMMVLVTKASCGGEKLALLSILKEQEEEQRRLTGATAETTSESADTSGMAKPAKQSNIW